MVNRFQSGSGVYTCRGCQKQTRETGCGEADLEYCVVCLYEQYAENAKADYGEDSQRYKEYYAEWQRLKAKQS